MLIIRGGVCLMIHLINPGVMFTASLPKLFYIDGLIGLNMLTIALDILEVNSIWEILLMSVAEQKRELLNEKVEMHRLRLHPHRGGTSWEVPGLRSTQNGLRLVRRIIVRDFIRRLHLHPIAVHFPNALFPLSLFFLMLFMFSGDEYYEGFSFILLFIAVFASPIALATGLTDWQIRYDGIKSPLFVRKIILSIMLIIVGVACLAIHLTNPGVMYTASLLRWFYVGGLFVINILTVALGYYGGKLVFGWFGLEL